MICYTILYWQNDLTNCFLDILKGRMELIPNTVFRMHMFRESEKRSFFKTYLEKRRELAGSKKAVTETDIDKLVDLAKPMELVKSTFQINLLI